MRKNQTKQAKGITLVALVITIIVLLILAGVTLNIVLNSGIINKSENAVAKYQDTSANETDQINYLDAIFGNFLSNITASGTSEGESNPPAQQTTYTVYTLGQEVIVGEENFFVIEENDSSTKDTITLITKYNLNPNANANEQLNGAKATTAMEFCTEPDQKGYWYEEGENASTKYPYSLNGVESDRATVYNKAVAYGTSKGGVGRLLTKKEAESLTASGKIPKIIYGQDYTINPVDTDNFLYFWLGTASDDALVYNAFGKMSYLGTQVYKDNDKFGVRPVITVSKTLVQLVQ